MSNANPYLKEVHANLPRLLALFDTDGLSATRGFGDRLYWAWKLKDFPNATFQGAAHGLARLLAGNALPSWLPPQSVLTRIEGQIEAITRLVRRNGSLEEAFPYESSYCVTALVAYDLLTAIELLGDRIDAEKRQRWLQLIAPLIRFLHQGDETHAVISNHLATAIAALLRWNDLTGKGGEAHARILLDRIFKHADPEGWLNEYGGADPGYQTLAFYYLADVDRMRPQWGVLPLVAQGCKFLAYFVHPDGSFGGMYGSRNTRIFYPAGLEFFAERIPEAAAIVSAMRESIRSHATVTLSAIDESNLIPVFNAYSWAAVRVDSHQVTASEILPKDRPGNWCKTFPNAGLLIDRRADQYTVISWRKGGVCYHFESDRSPVIDTGTVLRDSSGLHYSSQQDCPQNCVQQTSDAVVVRAALRPVHQELPTPIRFLVLRLLNLSIMRSAVMGNIVKRLLVRFLITRRDKPIAGVVRTITLAPEFSIAEEIINMPGGAVRRPGIYHSCIHMASQGYWQAGDDLA